MACMIKKARRGSKVSIPSSNKAAYEVYRDIFIAALKCGKWVSVEINPLNDDYVVSILRDSEVKNSDITNQIIESEYYGTATDEGKLVVSVPPHINQNSFKTRFYKFCDGYSLQMFNEQFIITQKTGTLNTKILTEDFKKGNVRKIKKSDCRNISSLKSTLYQKALKMGINVRIKTLPRTLVITHMGEIEKSEGPVKTFTAQVNQWLKSIPYDAEITIPERFTSKKTYAYINTVMNLSSFSCKIRDGKVSKRSAALRKRNGKIEVVVYDRLVLTVDKSSLSSISAKDRLNIDAALELHGKCYEDAR